MSFENDILIDVSNLRAIIHGIKMSGLSHVDQDAMPFIQEAIKKLPSPESISEISSDKHAVKNLAAQVGEILKLIEIYGKRGEEMKQRHKSLKQLPPRYKVLNWRKQNMNIATSGLIRNMVKVSSALDSRGKGDLSSKLLVCARNLRDEKVSLSEVDSLVKEISASGQEDLLKEAGIFDGVKEWAAGVKGGMQGAWQGAKNVGHQFGDPAATQKAFSKAMSFLQHSQTNLKGLLDSLAESEKWVYNPGMKQTIGQIKQQVSGLNSNAAQIAAALKEQFANLGQGLRQTTVPTEQGQQQGGQQAQAPGQAPQAQGQANANPDADFPFEKIQGLSQDSLRTIQNQIANLLGAQGVQ